MYYSSQTEGEGVCIVCTPFLKQGGGIGLYSVYCSSKKGVCIVYCTNVLKLGVGVGGV